MIAAVNVTAADSESDAARQSELVRRARVKAFLGRQGRTLTEDQVDAVMNSPQGQQIVGMLRYTAQGTGEQVGEYLEGFAQNSQADELMISFQAPTHEEVLNSMEITAKLM